MKGSRKKSAWSRRKKLCVLGIAVLSALLLLGLFLYFSKRRKPISGFCDSLTYPLRYEEQKSGTLLLTIEAETPEGTHWESYLSSSCFTLSEYGSGSYLLKAKTPGSGMLVLTLCSDTAADLLLCRETIGFAVEEGGTFVYTGADQESYETGVLSLPDGSSLLWSQDTGELRLWFTGSDYWGAEGRSEKLTVYRMPCEEGLSAFLVKAAESCTAELSFVNEVENHLVTLPVTAALTGNEEDADRKLMIEPGEPREELYRADRPAETESEPAGEGPAETAESTESSVISAEERERLRALFEKSGLFDSEKALSYLDELTEEQLKQLEKLLGGM